MPQQTASPHFAGLSLDLNHTLPEVIDHVAQRYGAKTFCVSETGARLSFEDLRRRVVGLSAALLRMGVASGDRLAIWAPNSADWIVAACSSECIGAIMVPINTRFKGQEARYVLETSRAKVLFTVPRFLGADFAQMLRDVGGGAGVGCPVAELPHLARIINIDEADFAPPVVTADDQALYHRAASLVTPKTIIDILFTSGTTGSPKGAMHNHGQALWMAATYNEANDLRETDRAIVVNPFFHSFGYRSGWVSSLIAGITLFPMATFDASAVLQLIERERITVLTGAPTLYQALLNHPEFARFDIASLRSGHTGGAKTPPDIIRAGYEKLGFKIFLTSFGQTESTALISTNRAGDPLDAIVQTVGRPVPETEVRIVSVEGTDQVEGDSGELLVRGPTVMQGYFEDAERTAQTIDKDGWLHTGDIARVDEDGRLRILDRIKDVVIVGGFNAYPAEIEIMMSSHPAIADVAVIGLPDERMGEAVAACVILKPGATLTLEEFQAWCRERMANYKAPRHLFICEDFPRTPLGKVQKFVLRERVAGGNLKVSV